MELQQHIDKIYNILLNSGFAENDLFKDYMKESKKAGNDISICCPFPDHKDETPSFSFSTVEPIYNCFGCGRSGNWFAFLQEMNGYSFGEALKHLERKAGVESLRGSDPEKWQKLETRETILKAFLKYCQDMLFKPEGKKTLDYLKGRAFTEPQIKAAGFGYFPGFAKTKKHLETAGFDVKLEPEKKHCIINSDSVPLKWLNFRDSYKLIFPVNNLWGMLSGVWGRSETSEKKYKPFGETKKDIPFYFDRVRGEHEAIITEGFLDAIKCQVNDLNNVMAINGQHITEKQIETLKNSKVQKIVLSFDNDKAGQRGTEKSSDFLASSGFQVYIVPESDKGKDPDEIIQNSGVQVYKELIEKAIPYYQYKAEKLTGAAKDTYELKTKALEYAGRIKARTDREYFLNIISEKSRISPEALYDEAEKIKVENDKRQRQQDYKRLLRDAEHLEPGELIGKLESLEQTGTDYSDLLKPVNAVEILESFRNEPESLKTEYQFEKDEPLEFPAGGLSIVAGKTGHGKSTFLMNIALYAVRSDVQGRRYYYFTFEESQKNVVLKAFNIFQEEYFTKNNIKTLKDFFSGHGYKDNSEGGKKIKDSLQAFAKLTENGCLNIHYSDMNVIELTKAIEHIAEREALGAVFIDYMQLLNYPGKSNLARYEELKEVCLTLKNSAIKTGIPYILAAQFNRDIEKKESMSPQKIGEASDIEKAAALILGLYKENDTDLYIKILKNRHGQSGLDTTLDFNGNIGKIKNKPKGDNPY